MRENIKGKERTALYRELLKIPPMFDAKYICALFHTSRVIEWESWYNDTEIYIKVIMEAHKLDLERLQEQSKYNSQPSIVICDIERDPRTNRDVVGDCL